MFKEKPSSPTKKIILSFREYMEKQEKLILSTKNLRAAEKFFRQQPNWVEHKLSRNELAQYFVESSQAENFKKKYSHP